MACSLVYLDATLKVFFPARQSFFSFFNISAIQFILMARTRVRLGEITTARLSQCVYCSFIHPSSCDMTSHSVGWTEQQGGTETRSLITHVGDLEI